MLVGQQIGPFQIERELGSGAMGAVYRGLYTKTGQRVAIKVMLPGMGENESAQKRFEREAEILKKCNHPNIVKLFGVGKHQGMRYYAMEYIEGESLDRTLGRRGRLTWEEVVTLGQQLCAALQHAHERGVVHRDLKPSNLMLLPDGTLKLTDFGIAKPLDMTQLTSANCTVGTASYMSPEQCRGERSITHKSDLYSLGIVFYELLTGKKPFVAENVMDMFMAHVQGPFEKPSRLVVDIPRWLDTLVCQLMEKKPELRPLDGATVAGALARVMEKVEAKQSAGVDAARARSIDRAAGDTPPDDTDRDAAQTLLAGKKKRKKKKIVKLPFYRKGWFQAVGIVVLLLLLGGTIYLIMRPPSAETLYKRAERLMASSNPADWKLAFEGPIQKYQKLYGGGDGHARQMEAWGNKVGVFKAEEDLQATRQRAKKLNEEKMDDLSPAWKEALHAVQAEDQGELRAAETMWAQAKQASEGKRDDRYLGLLADNRLRQFQEARDLVGKLDAHLANIEKPPVSEPTIDDKTERKAFLARRYERFGDPFEAQRTWEALKEELHARPEVRPWFLLAAGRAREIRPQQGESEKAFRLELIEKKLAEARKEKERANYVAAEVICLHIQALYRDAAQKEVATLAADAKKLFDDIQVLRKGKRGP